MGSFNWPDWTCQGEMAKQPCVYILASVRRGTFYIGVTPDLATRLWQHQSGFVDGFTKKYRVYLLVYVEPHATMMAAIQREKMLKRWNRAWKMRLIERVNPDWLDLSQQTI